MRQDNDIALIDRARWPRQIRAPAGLWVSLTSILLSEHSIGVLCLLVDKRSPWGGAEAFDDVLLSLHHSLSTLLTTALTLAGFAGNASRYFSRPTLSAVNFGASMGTEVEVPL